MPFTKGYLEISNIKIDHILDLQKKIKANLKSPLTELLNILFAGAINLGASDIHFEPEEKDVKIRLRIDGVLQNLISLPLSFKEEITPRVKLLSRIKINVTHRPQDGRFSIVFNKKPIEVRVSTLPSQYGESIVMRILNPKDILDINDLGIRKEDLNTIHKELKKPYGMIIVTGPTGAGKTTTLYAFLKEIFRPEIKIITIENPIEYRLKGISQTQVDPQKGYDFASGLKSIMRQDPDVILVGEIRDYKTAHIALQAALTGHLVLTTLHANNASGVISRILALGEKASNIAPALNFVIAQRLVRRVCPKCRTFKNPSKEEYKLLKDELKEIKNIRLNKEVKIPEAHGCEYCNFTGYKGRTGIFELFLVTDELKDFILKSPSAISLKKRLKKEGMLTMYQDGLIKVINGETTFNELERVLSEE